MKSWPLGLRAIASAMAAISGASDSLARVTGVQVTRAGGEANGVLVRGLPDITTTYNGRDIFTAEGRFVAVQDFAAGNVAALEVYKSTTADQTEGVGGVRRDREIVERVVEQDAGGAGNQAEQNRARHRLG